MRFFQAILTLLWKEIRIELRAKEILYSSLLFASILILLFSFAFLGGIPPTAEVKAGLLWVSLSFSLVLSIKQCFDREKEGNMFIALLLTPIPRFSIYVAKFLTMMLLTAITMLWVIPLMIFFLKLQVYSFGWLVLILGLGMGGFVGVACLFAGSIGKKNQSALLLPMLIYPLCIPLFIAGVRATCALLCDSSLTTTQCSFVFEQSDALPNILRWVKLLAIFDLFILLTSAWLFDPLCEMS